MKIQPGSPIDLHIKTLADEIEGHISMELGRRSHGLRSLAGDALLLIKVLRNRLDIKEQDILTLMRLVETKAEEVQKGKF